MVYTPEQCEELKILSLFNPLSPHAGIKVHASAKAEAISATRRLYEKGLVTQVDGGYLTRIGQQAAEHVHQLRTLLS
ncbi:MAG: TIGR02647 family protein [Gammaproteobacteria bacterium]|nr:TIGR02647 family protein [Gammaproteobacteria bacterium]